MSDGYIPAGPVIVVHLEDRPGSGRAACCGLRIPDQDTRWLNVPRVLCTGCGNRRPAAPPARRGPRYYFRSVPAPADATESY